jgi:diamine N-acetyltransferase
MTGFYLMERQIEIRLATPEDASIIAEISRRTFYDTFAAHNTPEDMDKFLNEQFRFDELVKEVHSPENIFIVAEAGNEVAGYAYMRESAPPPSLDELPSIEIARIYALQGMIGKGVGNALMKRCVETAYDMGKRMIWLGVWENNFRAIQFYNRWGFEKFDEHNFILGNDVQKDWLMKKTLG